MKSVFCTLFVFLVTTTSANANLIVNGGFETGTLSSWSSTNTIIVSSNGSHGGSYNAVFSQVSPPSYDTLSQTVSASPGTYNLDFWLYYNDATGQEFKVVFDGVTVVDLTSQLNSGGGAYIHVVENGITATDLNPVLTFESQNFVNYMRFDDVNLVAAIPEPSSLSLAGFGALGFIANEIRRRYSSRIQA